MRAARALGPGLLFAGAALGLSHLVQSSRAAAGFGLVIAPVLLVVSAIKYASFACAPRYAATTGTSLLEGYRQQGIGALLAYAALTLGTMFTLEAVVVLVTAQLLVNLFHLPLPPLLLSFFILCAGAGLLAVGGYRTLERIVAVATAMLAGLTLLAMLLLFPFADWRAATSPGAPLDRDAFLFLLAVIGWMPASLELSIWHSLWSVARHHHRGAWSLREALFDFDVGYLGTVVVALLLILLGAGLGHTAGAGGTPPAGSYPSLLVDLYARALGGWGRPLLGGAALCILFATTLAVLDGFPRAIAALLSRFAVEENPGVAVEFPSAVIYWGAVGVIACGALAVIARHVDRLGSLVDLATTLSIAVAPLLALLNHRAAAGAEVPAGSRLSPAGGRWSTFSIAFLTLFALTYLYVRFFA